ncbi:MAG: DegV family protein [Lachnospiraceae bacterium]|nr:DegV family protein [Lachnospiraceae bacterium]
MSDFVLSANSTVDLPKEWLDQNGINILPLSYTIDGETFQDYDEKLSSKDFFDRLRAGSTSITTQMNPEQAREGIEPLLQAGKDVLHLSFSSALSGTYNSLRLATEELKEEYPDRKIILIDTLSASIGEGMLVQKALELKKAGKSLEEVAAWVEENKLHVCHYFTVDDLHHLQRGGRVSKATAVIGTALQVKPILHMSDEGKLEKVGKERGRKKSLAKIVNMLAESSKGWDNDVISVIHGDCIEDAEYVASLVKEKMSDSKVEIYSVGSVIGSHTGPGLIAIFGMGEKR